MVLRVQECGFSVRSVTVFILLVGCTTSFQPILFFQHLQQTKYIGRNPSRMMSSEQQQQQSVDEITTTSLLDVSDDIWGIYHNVMTEVMESRRVMRKDSIDDIKIVQEYLISKEILSNIPSPITPSIQNHHQNQNQKEFYESMTGQGILFRDHYNFTMEQYQFAFRSLIYFADTCAKRKVGGSVMAIPWQKLKEAGMIPRENSVSTYMYTLSHHSDSSEDDGTSSSSSISYINEILDEVAIFHDLLYSPNEKTIFLRMKRFIGKGDIHSAEEILYSLPDKSKNDGIGEWKRLRTFLPILEYYCNRGDATSMLRLLKDMRQSPGVILDADAYAMVVGSLAKHGFFRQDASPIEGYETFGLKASHGPILFDEIAMMMGNDILELTEKAVVRLCEDFMIAFGAEGPLTSEKIPYLSNDGVLDHEAQDLRIGRVDITQTTGLCPATGARLRLLRLDDDQRQHVQDQLLEMARASYQEFTKNRAKTDDTESQNYGFEQLSKFSTWLDTREGEPFTAVVDGANVAYFGFPDLHYSQVKLVVDELRGLGENPLVIVPKKYTYPGFMLSSTTNYQKLSEKDLRVIRSLDDEGALYTVPPRCLDDYFWMLASVSNQTVARNKCDLRVPPENTDGRFPGLRPMLITNDQMRDHKLDLLEPREFRRWCSCHIVNYNLSAYDSDEWNDDRNVAFAPADFFSREIQGNPPEHEDGMVWHFPVIGWEEPSRFCVWIRHSK